MADLPIATVCHMGILIDRRVISRVVEHLKELTYIYTPRVGAPQRCILYRTLRQPNGLDIVTFPRGSLPLLIRNGFRANYRFPQLMQFAAQIEAPLDFLYEDQLTIIEHIRSLWAVQEGAATACTTACLNLRAGYGKTFIAAGIIALLRLRTLYIVPMRELAKQTILDLSATLQNSEPCVEIIYATTIEKFREIASRGTSGGLVCVAVINTVLAAAKSDMIACAFSLVIFDEVHSYCSLKRQNIFWLAQTHFMFGMSATLGERRDGFDFALKHHLAPVINAEDVEGFSYGENQFTCIVRVIRYHAKDEYSQNLRHATTDKVFAHYMYEQFARDPDRMTIIVDQARELLNGGHNIFIFAEERAHVEGIAQALCDAGLVRGSDPDPDPERDHGVLPRCVIFYGGVSDEERRVALCGNARVIIATYSYSGTGVSIVRMDAMILASPRYSGMKQIVGRILRRGSDVAIPRVIVDLVDQKTCLAHQFRLRRNTYAFYGATFERVTIRAPAQAPGPEAPSQEPH